MFKGMLKKLIFPDAILYSVKSGPFSSPADNWWGISEEGKTGRRVASEAGNHSKIRGLRGSLHTESRGPVASFPL